MAYFKYKDAFFTETTYLGVACFQVSWGKNYSSVYTKRKNETLEKFKKRLLESEIKKGTNAIF